jgi:O-antigen/teichoic acid export membrane protein
MTDLADDLAPMGAGSPGRRKRFEPLATTSWALMANTITTSALGMAFWAIASRRYSPQELGESAALVSAMILLSTVSQLNLGMGLTRLLPQVQHHRWRPVVGAYALTAVVGAVLTVGFLALVPHLPSGFLFLAHDTGLGLALVGAVVLWNIFALQDAVLTSTRWAAAIPVENGLFGLLKLVVMVWLADGVIGHGVFFAWLVAMALLLAPVNGLIFGRVLPSRSGRRDALLETALPLAERRRITRYLATDYVAALLSQGSTAMLPLLVIGVLGRADNAYFYVAFLITAAVGALAHSLSTSLVAEGAHDEAGLTSLTRRSIVRYATFVAPAVVVAIVAAPLLLAPFGGDYADHGTTLLRLLLAGTIPQALVTLYLGVERVRARVGRVLGVEAATVVLVVSGAVLGMRWEGLVGLGLAWLVAQVIVAGLVVPRLWKAVHPTSANPTQPVTLSTVGATRSVIGPVGQRQARTPNGTEPAVSAAFPSSGDLVDVGAVLVTAVLLVVAGMGVGGSGAGLARIALALVFVSFVPGWTVLNHVRLAEGTSRLALSVALSLTLGSAMAVSSLWLHLWHPRALLDGMGATCILALVRHLAGGGDHPAPSLSRTPISAEGPVA